MSNLLMLDSGAFSVWTLGAEIDLDHYIEFCQEHPGASYYVCLDKIPGKPGTNVRRTPSLLKEAAQETWNNYQRMIKYLPIEKVIPVYHRGEPLEWLQKYLDFGTPYIGFGQTGNGSMQQQKMYLDTIEPYILDSDRQLKVKTHGFAVTSFQLMARLPWHSVDSASWIKQASYGMAYIPYLDREGNWDYSRAPLVINFSPKSPQKREKNKHIDNLSTGIRNQVMRYLEEIDMPLGEYKIVPSDKKTKDELWYEKGKSVIQKVKDGCCTNHNRRFQMNARYFREANKVLPVDHIYLAGGEGSVDERLEYKLKTRLMSYHKVGHNGTGKTKAEKSFNKWCTLTDEECNHNGSKD